MSKETVDVTVDIREPPEVADMVEAHEDVDDVTLDTLESADIVIHGVGFERKTPSDFANSMTDRDDHLKDQVQRMNDQYEVSYVLLEGTLEDFKRLGHTHVKPKSLRGFIASLDARYGTATYPCGDLKTLVDMAIRLARKHIEDESTSSLKVKSSVGEDQPVVKRMYGCIDGVGPETADKMYQQYPRLADAIDASPFDWEAIDGIGQVTAADIHATLNASETETEGWNVR